MVNRVFDLPPTDAFRLVAALAEHGRWIPFTRVAARPGIPRVGDVVVARSAGLFVDRMRVTDLAAPHRISLRKLGPVLLGAVEITVEPRGERARVRWDYDVHLRGPLPLSVTRPVLGPVLDVMAAVALWRMARWVERTRPSGARR